MNEFWIAAIALGVIAVFICVVSVVVGVRNELRFDEHTEDALDLVAADDRNTRLDANAAWNGWY